MRELLQMLADGRFHSGEQLAAALGVTRAAVWKQLKRVGGLPGVQLDSVRGRGYRLRPGLELLDRAALADVLTDTQAARLGAVHIELQCDSTNSLAMQSLPLRVGEGHAWFAEQQLAGRGRRGRHWVSGFASDLTFSLAWRFDLPLARLAGLGLVAGVVLCETLEEFGLSGHGIKWPNDILVDGCKLAGILVEAVGEGDGPASAVIGVGVNLALPEQLAGDIDQSWTSLAAHLPDIPRNRLAGHLLGALSDACALFAGAGLAPFIERWREHDLLSGLPVSVHLGDRAIDGRAAGVDSDGALRVETAVGIRHFRAGEVSVRYRA